MIETALNCEALKGEAPTRGRNDHHRLLWRKGMLDAMDISASVEAIS